MIDYKFWILLLVCIVLFYMYHQIEEVKNDINLIHKKIENIDDINNFINKDKDKRLTTNLNEAINNILPKKNFKKNRSKSKTSSKNNKQIRYCKYLEYI